jgi:NTE family protein
MKKVGLVLSSGAARGIAHIGVLSILEKESIPVDMIAGTSIGAIIGGLYAAGKTSQEIAEAVININRRKMYSFFDFALSPHGFIRGKRVTNWLTSIMGNPLFEDLKIPFRCVAADIITGEKIVIKEGRVVDGIRASISIPVLYMPFHWQGRYLVDGGLVDPVPVDIAHEMGAELVIASTVSPDMGKKLQRITFNGALPANPPTIFSVIRRLMKIADGDEIATGAARADVIITPVVRGRRMRPGDRREIGDLISSGEEAAGRALPEVKRMLGTK